MSGAHECKFVAVAWFAGATAEQCGCGAVAVEGTDLAMVATAADAFCGDASRDESFWGAFRDGLTRAVGGARWVFVRVEVGGYAGLARPSLPERAGAADLRTPEQDVPE